MRRKSFRLLRIRCVYEFDYSADEENKLFILENGNLINLIINEFHYIMFGVFRYEC